MKKFLSTLLVASMLLSMIPAFAVTAAEGEADPVTPGYTEDADGFTTIDDAAEYTEYVRLVNAGTQTMAGTVSITADLDFADITTYAPLNAVPNNVTLDFGGHTIENLNYTVDASVEGYSGTKELGLIASSVGNQATVKNLTLKNSSFTVKGTVDSVAGIAGRLDRGAAAAISTDNFTINADGAAYVGLLTGYEHWSWQNVPLTLSGNLKDFTINAPKATVGILVGWAEDWGPEGMQLAIKNLTGNVTVTGAANVVTADTLVGNCALTAIETEAFTENVDQIFVDAATVNLTVENTTPAFKFATIDTAKELADFAAAINAGTIAPSGTVKVTANLDMSDVAYSPIQSLGFILDLDGHTISNLNLAATSATVSNGGQGDCLGLIANHVRGTGGVINGTLKDCSLTLDASGMSVAVGAVAGIADRGFINNVNLDNVSITTNAGGAVGGLLGSLPWSNASSDNLATTTMKDVTIDAPLGTVGAIVGNLGNQGIARKNTSVDVTVLDSANVVTNDTLYGTGTPAEGSTVDADTTTVAIDGSQSSAVKLQTIDSVEEFVQFVQKANLAGSSYRAGETILVTTNLDMSGVTNFMPIKSAQFKLDFQGNTVSNLIVTITPDNMNQLYANDRLQAGLIAGELTNGASRGAILNLKLENAVFDITVPNGTKVYVGGLIGHANRAGFENVDLKNVSVKVTALDAEDGTAGAIAAGSYVGGVVGETGWENDNPNAGNVVLNNVVIDAPGASVGVIYGNAWGDIAASFDSISGSITVVGSTNTVAPENIVGPTNSSSGTIGLAEGGTNTLTATDTNKGYCATGKHVEGTAATCTDKAVCKLCGESYGDAPSGHGGGTATCVAKAKCASCGTEYGEIDPDNHVGDTRVEGAVAANCTTAGATGNTICLSCNNISIPSAEIPALGHGTTELRNEVEATCSTPGYTGDEYCTVCNTATGVTGTTVPATGAHTGGTATCVAKAKCASCGTPYGEVDLTNHVGETEVRNNKKETCGTVGYTGDTYCVECQNKIADGSEIPATGAHTGGSANCSAKAACDICGQEYGEVDATKHENTIIQGASESFNGNLFCQDCQTIVEEGTDIDTTCEHANTEVQGAKEATCTEAGFTGNTFCNDCQGIIVRGETIGALGHSGGEATCDAQAVCDVCETAYGALDPENHQGETETKNASKATCTAAGYTGDTYCADCNEKIADGEVIEALGHGESTVVGAVAATCTVPGATGDKYCSVCGELVEAGTEIPATGHEVTELRDVVDATCTEDGYTGDTYCVACGEKTAAGQETAKLGHGETEIRDAVAATETEDGYTGDTYCTVCGEKIASGEVIPATGSTDEPSDEPSDEPAGDDNKYEAEDAVLASDPDREAAGEHIRINGNLVGWVGNGNTITFTVNAETAGKKTLTIVHTGPNDRSIEITVNGGTPVTVAGTDSVAVVELVAGENTIVLGNSTGWAPDIDYITLEDVANDGNTGTDQPDVDQPSDDKPSDDKPAQTGDATMFAVVLAVVALLGAAIVSKKRHTVE